MNEPEITIVGNLTADPEMRFLSNGSAVASFTIAATPRKKQGDEWVDGETLFLRCSAWRKLAENAVEHLSKGQRVIARGRLSQRSWEAQDGGKRTVVELTVDEIGAALSGLPAKPAGWDGPTADPNGVPF